MTTKKQILQYVTNNKKSAHTSDEDHVSLTSETKMFNTILYYIVWNCQSKNSNETTLASSKQKLLTEKDT